MRQPTHERVKVVAAALLGLGAMSVSAFGQEAETIRQGTCRAQATAMTRVELYFGAGRATRRRWTSFLMGVVTPRFPEGFTSLDGSGQWRGPHGLARERTHVLVIYYRRDATSDARIEAVRSAYRAAFAQTSVLRVDSTACVSF